MGGQGQAGRTVRIPADAFRKLSEIADRRQALDGFRPSHTCIAATALHGLWLKEVGSGAERLNYSATVTDGGIRDRGGHSGLGDP